jgi:hypothetical protein
MRYVIKKCPNCKDIYYTGHDRRGIGIPYKTCILCKTIIIDEAETEWELKNLGQKFVYILICIWTSILFGAIGPIMVYCFNELTDTKTTDKQGLYAYIIGIIIFGIIFYRANIKDIQLSKERMKDANYRGILKKLGLLE